LHVAQHSNPFEHPLGAAWYALSPVDDVIALVTIKTRKGRAGTSLMAPLVRVLVVDNANARTLCNVEVGEKRLEETGFRLQFSLDGTMLAVGGTSAVRVIRIQPTLAEWHFQGPSGLCLGLAFSPDGKQLSSLNEDGSALVWDLAA